MMTLQLKVPTRSLEDLVSTLSKVAGDTVGIEGAFSSLKDLWKTVSFTIPLKTDTCRCKLKDLSSENYKELMKETEYSQRWKGFQVPGNTEYFSNVYAIKSTIHIQPVKFFRNVKKNPEIHMGT